MKNSGEISVSIGHVVGSSRGHMKIFVSKNIFVSMVELPDRTQEIALVRRTEDGEKVITDSIRFSTMEDILSNIALAQSLEP
jgi:hypothetical protein|tara:strand:+ start:1408 stop:1653 length:246 start_codon:yes stop_codon:yes gene_type:complete